MVSIQGPRADRLDVARAICVQLAVLHAPEEVRLLICTGPSAAPDWEWVKWLPHLGVEGERSAGTIDDPTALDTLISSRVARARRVQAGADLLDSGPWLVVLVDGVIPMPDTVAMLRRAPSRTTLVVLAGVPAD